MKKIILIVGLVIGSSVAAFAHDHPYLNQARNAIDSAIKHTEAAQRANRDELGGHAEKAISMLRKAREEVHQAQIAADQNKVVTEFKNFLEIGAGSPGEKPISNVWLKKHPQIFEAQKSVQAAWRDLAKAQKANEYDLNGHAKRVEDLLREASHQLKQAAIDANRK